VLRVVLLGASNLKISFPRGLARLRGAAPGPVEVLVALGHGRSYGTWSRLAWVRLLPGIVQCGLWEELERRHRRHPLPTVALVTDVGNDLLYGVPVPRIAGWVGTCLERLARQEAEIIVALLPLSTLEKVSPVRYHLARQILFPGRRAAPWSAVLDSARELNERLRRLGLEHGARLVEPSPSWYGIDPIHVRRSMRSQAWNQMLDHPLLPREGQPAAKLAGKLEGTGRLPLFGSAELRLFGVPLRNPQPVCRFKDGSTVALY
jgi:hypothetical protein